MANDPTDQLAAAIAGSSNSTAAPGPITPTVTTGVITAINPSATPDSIVDVAISGVSGGAPAACFKGYCPNVGDTVAVMITGSVLMVMDALADSQSIGGPEQPGDMKIVSYNPASPPPGWLPTGATAVSRTTYARLCAVYDALGFPWGDGDGLTTFNLPNMGGVVPIGTNGSYALALVGGAATAALVAANLPAHVHTFSASVTGMTVSGTIAGGSISGLTASGGTVSGTVSGTTGTESEEHTHGPESFDDFVTTEESSFDPTVQSGSGTTLPTIYYNTESATGTESEEHTHTFEASISGGSVSGITVSGGTISGLSWSGSVSGGTVSGNTGNGPGSGTAFSILQPYVVVGYLVKT